MARTVGESGGTGNKRTSTKTTAILWVKRAPPKGRSKPPKNRVKPSKNRVKPPKKPSEATDKSSRSTDNELLPFKKHLLLTKIRRFEEVPLFYFSKTMDALV